MSRPSRIAIVKELGSRTPRCLAAHAVRGEGDPELVVVERYPAGLGAEVLATIEQDTKDLVPLDHANIASVISTAKLKGDVAVLSEWVDGESLATVRMSGEKPPVPVLLRAFMDVLEGLNAVHASREGRICGSLTSDDVFVGMDGVTRITRFGLAAVALDALGPRRKVYAPPELAHGERSVRGDVFTAGVLLWECLTGEQASRDVTWGISPIDESKLESWARPLVAIVEKACAIEPAERYATIKEMAEAITSADPIMVTRAGVAQYIARAFGERIAARLAKLEPKSDVALPSINAPPTTEPPPAVEVPKPVAVLLPQKEPIKPPDIAPEPVAAKPVEQPPAKPPEKAPEKVPEKVEKLPEKPPEKAAARKPATDSATVALARKPVPLPKRVVPPVATPTKTNGSTPNPKPATPATTATSSAKVPIAKRVAEPEPDSEPPPSSREELDVDIDLASIRPPPRPPPQPEPEEAPPPSSREDLDSSDVDMDIVSVRPPPVAVARPTPQAETTEPAPSPRSGRSWIVLLVALLFFGGGFLAGRHTTPPEPTNPQPSATATEPRATTTSTVTVSAATTSAPTTMVAPSTMASVPPSASVARDKPALSAAAELSGRPAPSAATSAHYNPSGI